MASEDELLTKLINWRKTKSGPISAFTALETGDDELVAAYAFYVPCFVPGSARSVPPSKAIVGD